MLSFRTLAHETPGELLQDFFRRHELEIAKAPGTPAKVTKAIKNAVAYSAPGVRKRVDSDLRIVERLSTEAGQAAIRSIASSTELAELPTAVARSLWLLLREPTRLETALDRLYFDEHRTPRQWNAYRGPKSREPKLDAATIELLKDRLRTALDTSNIHIEHCRFGPDIEPADESEDGRDGEGSQAIQFTIYSEDLPNTEHVFVEGVLRTETRSKVIQGAAIYDQATGVIECVSRRKQDREAIVREIGRLVLDHDPSLNPEPARRYDLTTLGKRRSFETDPRDRIESVAVTMLRLSPLHNTDETVTVDRASRSAHSIWDAADFHLGSHRLESQYRITRAKLVIKHKAGDINRLCALPVIITPPFGSNIKEQGEFERKISQKYLTAWGLAEPQ